MKKELNELRNEMMMFVRWAISGAIDSIFLIIWVCTQWITNMVISNLHLSGIDRWVLIVFQVLFAIATLAPVTVYIYVDTRIMLLRAKQRIAKEMAIAESFSNTSKHLPVVMNETANKDE